MGDGFWIQEDTKSKELTRIIPLGFLVRYLSKDILRYILPVKN